MPFVRQALQLGRVVDAIVKCLLIDDSHLPLGSSDLSKLALRNKTEMLGDIGVLIEPDEPDNDDLLGRRTVLRSVRSVRNVLHRIQSKRGSRRDFWRRRKDSARSFRLCRAFQRPYPKQGEIS